MLLPALPESSPLFSTLRREWSPLPSTLHLALSRPSTLEVRPVYLRP
jgi:hypothetical protein